MYERPPHYEVLSARSAQFATAQTNVELVAAVPGKRIVIDLIIWAVGTTSIVCLLREGAGNTDVGPPYVSFGGIPGIYPCHVRLGEGNALKFNTGAVTAASYVYVEYHLEGGSV